MAILSIIAVILKFVALVVAIFVTLYNITTIRAGKFDAEMGLANAISLAIFLFLQFNMWKVIL